MVLVAAMFAFLALSPGIRVRFRDVVWSVGVFLLVLVPFPLTVVLAGHTPETTDWVRHPLLASVTLFGYAAVAVVAAALFFRTRDIAGAS